ncbi:MAG: hypothetical protein ABWW70_07005 [Thermoproteota archaeon]
MVGVRVFRRANPSIVMERLQSAIEVYNKYRGAESRAQLVKVVGDLLLVRFEGSFCETCGINDWVDDLRYILEDMGVKAELVRVLEPKDPDEFYSWRLGVFRIVGVEMPNGEHKKQ